jgi:hypothetical protein
MYVRVEGVLTTQRIVNVKLLEIKVLNALISNYSTLTYSSCVEGIHSLYVYVLCVHSTYIDSGNDFMILMKIKINKIFILIKN